MNPQWVTAGIAVLGLAANGLWTTINLRIENRVLERMDALKEWCDQRFVRRPDAPAPAPGLPPGRKLAAAD